MRVKSFTADTTARAMNMVRDALGDEAIIVSTRTENDGSTMITAAIEPPQTSDPAANEDFEEVEPLVFPGETEATIRQALTYHGVPPWLAGRLSKAAAALEQDGNAGTAILALATALDDHFTFQTLATQWPAGPLLVIGPPGGGKTITAAKLCARECLAKRPVAAITADTRRAGGVEQLAAFTRILGIELTTAASPAELISAVDDVNDAHARVIIDTPGVNPFDDDDMRIVLELVRAVEGSAVLVLAAGADPMEAADLARAYADIGAERMIVTRMDMARRFGALLAAADGAGLSFAEVSISAQVADGLTPVSPLALARLMLPHTEENTRNDENSSLQDTTEALP